MDWTTAPDRRRLKIIGAVLVALLCVADTARFLRAMEKRKPTLKRWLPQAAELGTDERLYERNPDYLYPPFFLALMRPLTKVPMPVAAVIWQFAKYVCIGLIFAAAWGLVARAGPFPAWAKVVSVVVTIRFIESDLSHGNVNLFIACLITCAAWLIWQRREVAAGALVALAACIKVTPALWAVWLVYKRRWRALIGLIVGTVIALEVVPLTVISPSMNHALLKSWYHHVIGGFTKTGVVASQSMNQSLPAITNRLLGRAELAEGESPPTIVELSDSTVRWVQRGAAAVFLLLLAWSCRGPMPRDPLVFAMEWSIVAPVALALSGYTWTGHFCSMILAVVTLTACWSDPQRRSRPVAILTIIAFGLVLFTTDIITPKGRQWAATYGLPLLGALMMGVALFVARRRARRSETSTKAAA